MTSKQGVTHPGRIRSYDSIPAATIRRVIDKTPDKKIKCLKAATIYKYIIFEGKKKYFYFTASLLT